MKVAFVTWRDACAHEAREPHTPVVPMLTELHEVGFLLGESDEAVTIGMEQAADTSDTEPGRWRLHIPRSAIVFMKVVESDKVFAASRRKKAK